MRTLTVTVKQRTVKGETTTTALEGVYQLPSSTTAKLARKDGTTLFPNRGALSQAAKRLAATLGWQAELVDPQQKKAAKTVKATKKPAVKASTATACCAGESCSTTN